MIGKNPVEQPNPEGEDDKLLSKFPNDNELRNMQNNQPLTVIWSRKAILDIFSSSQLTIEETTIGLGMFKIKLTLDGVLEPEIVQNKINEQDLDKLEEKLNDMFTTYSQLQIEDWQGLHTSQRQLLWAKTSSKLFTILLLALNNQLSIMEKPLFISPVKIISAEFSSSSSAKPVCCWSSQSIELMLWSALTAPKV
ncbi:hypothetical protein BT96DRAFT_950070 [Gymnopus androsaceus JB14]|uniref:Uncharacterized protein n=1 Tax=Gymnopus androsaceus JB14 TaxID=1447944 RepID=A0A6A4GIN3_9AGAR|nr:hypothetical protein BT96DRAFT_950070 [Gymnopus androsaceus JB14]